MKIAIVYNRDSKRVINLFGIPNQEKIGLKTIQRVANGLKKRGHRVKTIEGDKDLVGKLEDFMPRVVKGEIPGLVFNVSYGIQGQARYTHVPSILEMVGIPYVGSGPLAHSLALDKVVAKMIFQQNLIPTPQYAVLNSTDFIVPNLPFPLIVKPKNEAVSFGMRIVNNEDELREGAANIFNKYNQPVLVEQYIKGREINVGLIGNNPPETLPPVELLFGKQGPPIYTYDDKRGVSDREIGWQCPAEFDEQLLGKAQDLALKAFSALGCYDCARVDMRVDGKGNLYVLEVNSLPSLGEHGSYTIAAKNVGLEFDDLVCRLVNVASSRYFGTPSPPDIVKPVRDIGQKVFSYLVERRDEIEKRVQDWTQISSRTSDTTGILAMQKKLARFADDMGLESVRELTGDQSAWTWQTKAGMDGGTLLVGHIDVALGLNIPAPVFRRDPEWLYGEGIGSSRAPLVSLQYALKALRSIRRLKSVPLGVLLYSDEGVACRYSHSLIEKAASRANQVLVLRPGNPDNHVVNQRRGWRTYKLTITGKPRRLGKIYRKRGVLRCSASCINEISKLTSKNDRVAVACSELKSEAYPHLLPHRVTATILVSFLDLTKANRVEADIKNIIKSQDYQHSLELISERPSMKKSKAGRRLLSELQEIADQWEIPLDHESSLFPSVAGLAPTKKAVICGLGPVARDIDTPQEAVLRISLMQRTLLLAQFLSKQVRNRKK